MHLIMTDRSVMGFFAIVIMFQKKKGTSFYQFRPVSICQHWTYKLLFIFQQLVGCQTKYNNGNDNYAIHPF